MEQVLVTPVVAVRLEHFIVAPSFCCILIRMLSTTAIIVSVLFTFAVAVLAVHPSNVDLIDDNVFSNFAKEKLSLCVRGVLPNP